MIESDKLILGGVEFNSRLFIGTGKYPQKQMLPEIIKSCGTEMVTVALRRVDLTSPDENILDYIDKSCTLLPNTSGARDANEAVRIARLARAAGMGNFIKIEVISDQKYLLPDNLESIKATEILAKEGFIVLPYMNPDLMDAKRFENAGAAAVMPLGAPIGTNKGLRTKEMIEILIRESKVPVIVDAGIGVPSQATEAMEMGADAVLVNTAIASADNPILMAKAFGFAVQSGRLAYLAGKGDISTFASASSPLTGFLNN
ncbi:thiazole synthase [bacterium]|nr:thiazole synthase [bacterium]